MKFSDKTDEELGGTIRLGAEVEVFIKGEFFTNRLKPQMDKERDAAKANGDWFPGKTTDLAAIAITNAFNSGVREGIRIMEATLGKLIQDSREAEKEIKYRVEKAKK